MVIRSLRLSEVGLNIDLRGYMFLQFWMEYSSAWTTVVHTRALHLETEKSQLGSRPILFFVQTFSIYSEASHNLINASAMKSSSFTKATEIQI